MQQTLCHGMTNTARPACNHSHLTFESMHGKSSLRKLRPIFRLLFGPMAVTNVDNLQALAGISP
jgi:hypothetical protein